MKIKTKLLIALLFLLANPLQASLLPYYSGLHFTPLPEIKHGVNSGIIRDYLIHSQMTIRDYSSETVFLRKLRTAIGKILGCSMSGSPPVWIVEHEYLQQPGLLVQHRDLEKGILLTRNRLMGLFLQQLDWSVNKKDIEMMSIESVMRTGVYYGYPYLNQQDKNRVQDIVDGGLERHIPAWGITLEEVKKKYVSHKATKNPTLYKVKSFLEQQSYHIYDGDHLLLYNTNMFFDFDSSMPADIIDNLPGKLLLRLSFMERDVYDRSGVKLIFAGMLEDKLVIAEILRPLGEVHAVLNTIRILDQEHDILVHYNDFGKKDSKKTYHYVIQLDQQKLWLPNFDDLPITNASNN